MSRQFHKQVVVVTAGASGIGRELVRQLAIYGAIVVIADINAVAGAKLQAEVAAAGGTVVFMPVDMTDAALAKQLVADVVGKYGRIDYFYNGVGIVMGGELRDTPVADWHKVVETNLRGTINGTHFAYQQMLVQGHGHILNFASAAGLFPVPVMAVYSAIKFAVVGLTQALRAEARDLGIKVSVICPGIVDTPIYETAIYHTMDREQTLHLLVGGSRGQAPATAARRIIAGTVKNKAVIHTVYAVRLTWWLYRLSPILYLYAASRLMGRFRQHLRTP